MLQQTQVRTVEGYYERFIERFPTVESLAGAEIGEVMKVWEGLGYYGRARNMHRAAQEIVERFDGRIPDDVSAMMSLPGIGRYTAGAVLSIAYGKRVPVLDGNVTRLLSRIFHVTDDVGRAATQSILWDIAGALLPVKRLQDFNQAMMELGSVVCSPRRPSCETCPLSGICEANRLGIQEFLPVKTPKKPVPHYDVTAGIIWNGEKLLITLRPPKGLLGGLWEFPGGKQEKGESLEDCLRREIREELDIEIGVEEHLVSVKHAYSHFRITLHAYMCRYIVGKIVCHACDDYQWILPAELDDFAFPAADRKIISLLKNRKKRGSL